MSVYALLVAGRVVAVDQGERLEHVLDRLHARVRASLALVLAPVVVDVAEAALLLGAEVLAEAQHGEVDQVAPLDRRRRLHHRLAVREQVAVVLRHRRQVDVGERHAVDREPERPVLGHRDAVGRAGVHAHRDDRAAEPERPAGERELLGRPPQRCLAELRQGLLVEREDEVRLRLDLALEVVAQGRGVERHPGAEQILLQHGLGRHVREALDQGFEERRAGAGDQIAHPCTVTVGRPSSRKRTEASYAGGVIKLGRISYVNMAPVFHRLEYDVEEITGVPTELNRLLLDGQLDIAPISSIEYARHADSLRLLPRLCVSSEGAVDSIQLVTRMSLGRVRSVAVTPESATSVVLTKVLLPAAEIRSFEEEADAKLLIGDAALKSAFEDPTPHYDLGRLWLEKTGLPMVFAVWAAPEPLVDGHLRPRACARRLRSPRPLRAREARLRGERALRVSARLPGALLREAPLQLRPPRAGRLLHLPRDGPRRRRAAPRARAPLRARRRSSALGPALDAGRVELRGETGNPVAPVDPHAVEPEQIGRRRETGRGRRRAEVPGRSHRRDHRVVEPPRRVTEEVDRDAELRCAARRASRPPPARARQRRASSGRDASACGRRAPSLPRSAAGPASPTAPTTARCSAPRDRARRASRGRGGSAPPSRTGCGSRRRTRPRSGGSGMLQADAASGQYASWSVTAVEAVAREPVDLAGEVVAGDVELRITGARRWVGDHVVHEDRDRVVRRLERSRGSAGPADASVVTPLAEAVGRRGASVLRRRRRARAPQPRRATPATVATTLRRWPSGASDDPRGAYATPWETPA